MLHPASEQPLFDKDDRILGWMSVARGTISSARCYPTWTDTLASAIGDYSLKFRAPYLANLFRYLPGLEEAPFHKYIPKIKTPPYIIGWPSARFTDLEPYWSRQLKVFLFSDGVDNIVDGWQVFKPRQHSGADPIDVVSSLLADGEIEPRIADILGNPVIPCWSGQENNRAIDVLGNLLGGTNIERLEAVTDLERLTNNMSWPFHIDDTSIIVWQVLDR
ncbi:hypothetical protein TRAPUB_5630 [Trametes pubescens]|uniref:Uncharacterized protein n=1 Tax=Trametes pubescens TaxID=154538 RepID=A0A1M2V832_TRAPU|nr:hypothetical protein TRAPUB_5630 [Trametes pubescens]